MPEMQQISSMQVPDKSVQHLSRTRAPSSVPVGFFVTAALLVIYGLIVSFSATADDVDYSFPRQLMGVIIGVGLLILFWRLDYHQLSDYVTFFLCLNVVLILLPHLPFIGQEVNGAQSWVRIGPLGFQPGEFAKVTVILLCACVVARYGGRLSDLNEYLKALAIMAVPFICIMTQPDLGTGLVYLFIAAVALIIGGARWKYLLVTLGVIAGLIVLVFLTDPLLDAIFGTDVFLKDYQRSRLLVFLDSSYDPTGNGYNLQQAKIAIGSGGLFGKGFMGATQSSLGFLPEAPTDFVFCVLAEEFGFIGAIALLALYGSLIFNGYRIARSSNDLFGSILVTCILGMWLFQILQNIGMTCGLMPITGIPLPFVSYGSSFMLVNFICLGLIASVWAHNGR